MRSQSRAEMPPGLQQEHSAHGAVSEAGTVVSFATTATGFTTNVQPRKTPPVLVPL